MSEIGSLTITKESGSAANIVFVGEPLEDVVGGATLLQARLPEGNEQVLGGAMINITDGQAELIKTASVITGGSATAIRVNKDHKFVVGNFVMLAVGAIAYAITVIDTTNADYDVITIGTTLGSTPVTGQLLVEAAAESAATTSAALFVANAILKETIDTTRANSNCSGVVRGSVYSGNLPYGAFADDIAALKLIRFV